MKNSLLLLALLTFPFANAYADAKQSTYPDLGTFNPATDRMIGLRNNNTNAKFMAGVGTVSGLQPCTTDGTKAAANNTILQAALTAGGEVFIPIAATYCNSATLVIGSNTNFHAVQGTKIINIAGVFGPVLTNATHSAPGDTNISVENIFFDGNKAGNSTTAYATVWMYYGDHYFFNNDRFDGGVRLVSFPNGTFGEGLRLHNVTASFVSNSDAQNNLYDGFKVNGGGDNVLTNLHAANNGRCGVQLTYDNYNNGGPLLPTPTSLTQSYRNAVSNLVVDNISATPPSVSPETCGVYVHGSSNNTITNVAAINVNQLFGHGDSSTSNNFSNSNGMIVSDGVHGALANEAVDAGFTTKFNTFSNISLSGVSGSNGIIIKDNSISANNLYSDIVFDLGTATGSWQVITAGTNTTLRSVRLPSTFTLTDTGTNTNMFDVGSTTSVIARTGSIIGATQTLTISSSAFTIDASKGNTFIVTLNGSTITANAPTNPFNGQKITLLLIQDATGSRTVAWNGAFSFGTAGTPTLSTAATKADQLEFVYNSTLAKWLYAGGQFGF